MGKTRVAIIGGGIAGLYAAWRLKDRGDLDLVVYEAKDRIGGRICTMDFGICRDGGPPVTLSAELGAMRFPNQHKLLISLYRKLGDDLKQNDTSQKPEIWRGPFELKSLFHLRGKTLTTESFQHEDIPYHVRGEERGKTPGELLEYAIFRMLDQMIEDYVKRPE
ncbi:MAG: FAD-dependent oxidoreductase, partial [Candidatus Binatia bacterium]